MNNDDLNTIYLFITEGCEGCKIAERLVNEAVETSDIKISFEVCNIKHESFCNLAKLYGIDDFPTALFVKKGLPVGKIIGTTTVNEIVKEINRCFK